MKVKKVLFSLLALSMIFINNSFTNAEEDSSLLEFKTGDYCILGKYNNEPIIWRYVDTDYCLQHRNILGLDENRILLYSDKILCFKKFDDKASSGGNYTNSWRDSTLRKWLNSETLEKNCYGEYGFLSDGNFNQKERNVIKEVNINTFIAWEDEAKESKEFNHSNLFENSCTLFRYPINDTTSIKKVKTMEFMNGGKYLGTTDRLFLLDERQVYQIYTYYRTAAAEVTLTLKDIYANENYNYKIWLRSPYNYDNSSTYIGEPHLFADISVIGGEENDKPFIKKENSSLELYTYQEYGDCYSYSNVNEPQGVRPAFYLDEEKAVIVSGSGTEEDPYILTGKGEGKEGKAENNNEQSQNVISVFCNGSEISFDQSPFIENDRVLVPMRAIFEELGATVLWEERTETITATDGYSTVVMQIGNNIIAKNDEDIEAEVAPRIIGDRTFVPLRVISESLGAEVNWDDESHTVTINR